MHILLTNDDGIYAPGLLAMYRRLSELGRVTVAAPSDIRSGAGHSITLKPITCETVEIMGHFTGFSVDGTPGDCVKLALHKLLDTTRTPVDLVVSGINHGSNLGVHVFYSGTVAAAVEGAFNGIPSIAVSGALDEPMDMEADRGPGDGGYPEPAAAGQRAGDQHQHPQAVPRRAQGHPRGAARHQRLPGTVLRRQDALRPENLSIFGRCAPRSGNRPRNGRAVYFRGIYHGIGAEHSSQ